MSLKIILGIGNPLGGDDAIGSFVARAINEKLGRKPAPHGVMAIDAGSAPESYTSVIRRSSPEQLILVDASDMGLPPGSIRRLSPEQITTTSFSTHQIPLSAFLIYVQEFCEKVHIIGIQPERTATGDKLSETVQKSADHLVALILSDRLDEIKELG